MFSMFFWVFSGLSQVHSGSIPDPYESIPDRGPVRKNLISPATGSLPEVTLSGEQPPAARYAGAKLDQNLDKC